MTPIAWPAMPSRGRAGKRSEIPGGPLIKLFYGFNRVAPAWFGVPVAQRMMARELERSGTQPAATADRSPA